MRNKSESGENKVKHGVKSRRQGLPRHRPSFGKKKVELDLCLEINSKRGWNFSQETGYLEDRNSKIRKDEGGTGVNQGKTVSLRKKSKRGRLRKTSSA